MTVEEIVRDLINGEDVHLEPIVYDFTGYHSIPVHSNIYGNGAVITCSNYYETGVDGVENSALTFLFNAFEGSSFENLCIIGPNDGIGSVDYTEVWGAINIIESSYIRKCKFLNCDKWGIRVESKGATIRTSWIEDCVFSNIKRQGYGYAIWNAYGDARVSRCKFFKCRHAIDMSSQRACYIIRDCEFDRSNYIHINMHGYGNDNSMTSGDKISIASCKFYDTMQPLQLKLPYTSTGFIEITSCDFLVSEDKVGLIANSQPIKGFTHPQFSFKNNTFNGSNLPVAPIVEGSSRIKISQVPDLKVANYSEQDYIININPDILFKFRVDNSINTYEIIAINKKLGTRSLTGYKDVVISNNEDIFSFNCRGFDSTIEVLCEGKLIDRIRVTDEWNYYDYTKAGRYELRLSGSGYVLLDNWLEINSKRVFSSTFETDYKIKFSYNSMNTIKVGLVKGESYSGNGCLKVTLNGQGNITLRNNVDK